MFAMIDESPTRCEHRKLRIVKTAVVIPRPRR